MAQVRITDLDLIPFSSITIDDVFPIVDIDADVTYKIDLEQLGNYLSGLNNRWYIESGETITVRTNTQSFIYGDLLVYGELFLEENSKLFVVNGNIELISGGTITGDGTTHLIEIPEFDTYVTGGTYSAGTATFINNKGESFNVVGFYTGATDGVVSAFTYNNSNTFTISDNLGQSYSATFDVVTGLTATTLSATTYQNLPSDIFVTGGTFNEYSGTVKFKNSVDGEFDLTGLTISNFIYIPSGETITVEKNTQKFVYGDIIIDGDLVLEDGSQLLNLNGDIIVSGGTISGTGDIISVDLPEIDTKVTGFTYNNNEFTILNNFGTSYSVTLDEVTGLTVNGLLSANTINAFVIDLCATNGALFTDTISGCSPIDVLSFTNFHEGLSGITISGGTFYGDGSNLSGISTDNFYTSGATLSGNTILFSGNSSGSTFLVNMSGLTYYTINTSPTQTSSFLDGNEDYIPIGSSIRNKDNADNYISWTNGSNNGNGFNPWVITTSPNTGTFLGNPANDGMGTSGIGVNAFALFATDPSNYVNANRTFVNGLSVGDKFTFYWAINFDANGGNKGFDLKSGGVTIFNANNNNSSTITSNLPFPYNVVDSGYGVTPMFVTLTRTTDTQYTITITSRSGGSTFNAPINSSSSIDEISFYCGAQSDGLGQRNLYFNNFVITRNQELQKITVENFKSYVQPGGVSGDYLPLSGGTVTGNTIFTQSISANTISGVTFYGDGSNLTGINQSPPIYVTGNVISFESQYFYNSRSLPGTGNITEDLTNAQLGTVQKIYHNDVILPSFPAGWILIGSGTYTLGVLNIIMCEWIGGTSTEYWIIQDQ